MDYATARHNMVESQIRTNDVTDMLVVDAMEELPREAFVPKALAGVAYVDEALQVAPGRYMMEPLVLASLAQAARIQADDVVLMIGCGTGYAAAVVSKLASTVVAVEQDGELSAQAGERLAAQGIDNVAVVEGDLAAGYPDQAPYDVIFFNGAVGEVPKGILDQLADGGRCVAVVDAGRATSANGRGTVFLRTGDVTAPTEVFDAGTPYLPGFEPKQSFVF